MAQRFYAASPVSSDRVRLTGAEAHHLVHVLRARLEDEVTLFDGSGFEFTARIREIGRTDVELEVTERRAIERELHCAITLGVALPKGDRQRWLVEKAVELGVTQLIPLEVQRGVAQPVSKALVRLQRTVVEASKQCGRNRLMEITSPQPLEDFLRSAGSQQARLLAHPGHQPVGAHWWKQRAAGGQFTAAQLAVGPEGGFTEGEVDLALSLDWELVSLGPAILRVETAAVALVAMLTALTR